MSDSQYFRSRPEVASKPIDVDVSLNDVAFSLRTDTEIGRAHV